MSSKTDRITFQNRLNDMIDTLRQDILTFKRPAGAFIPSELTLAEQYQLSRKSVRKGLDILVAEGLLKKVPRVGNMINTTDDFQTITIRLGYYPSMDGEAALHELLKQFHRLHPHILVEALPLPYRNYIEAARGFMDNGWLDVITLNNKDYLDALERNSLDILEPQTVHPDQYSFLAPNFTHKSTLYAQPIIFSPLVLCYNKSMFQQLGLSEPDSGWSWKELSETANRIKDELDILGYYADIASLNRFLILLLQKEYKFEAVDGGYNFNDPLLWECLTEFRDLFYNQGKAPAFLSEADADTEKLFLGQKTAMIITSYFGMQFLKEPSFEYDIAPLPYNTTAKTLLLVTGLAVCSQSKQKEAAQLLVDFISSPVGQLYIRRHTMSIPAHKPSAEWNGEGATYQPSRFFCYRDIIPTFRSYKDLEISISALERLQGELKLFMAKLEEPESVIERLTLSPSHMA